MRSRIVERATEGRPIRTDSILLVSSPSAPPRPGAGTTQRLARLFPMHSEVEMRAYR